MNKTTEELFEEYAEDKEDYNYHPTTEKYDNIQNLKSQITKQIQSDVLREVMKNLPQKKLENWISVAVPCVDHLAIASNKTLEECKIIIKSFAESKGIDLK